ncbi:tripartite tricarboxylate transporter substrate binding protein [Bradyrhizobium sp. BR 10289]|uniref:Bug family tripartite tricarboxylate transporter substrate binding protein n=1 Tax=Bradyrhizobium sp. BR 10289 TaxID=2749993 RepID=UPI001C648041|nr:tripartite tricarboxylate transporter substrate binding protein [Bradyrhizobium sp. BR 10289]MBW7970138.1 tripartite tricarboxylate transporter substrate binding protein [Bradyrhizobium sp. BR 10289]
MSGGDHVTGLFRREFLFSGLAALTMAPAGHVSAEVAWPKRVLRFFVPFAAGGGIDTVTRVLADTISKSMGARTVVENKPGAMGGLAAREVIRSADDHTFLVGTSAIAGAAALEGQTGYDPVNDLMPVTLIGSTPLVMAFAPDMAPTNVAELVEQSQREPIPYASPGIGTVSHLSAELFRQTTGAKLSHVPYRGSSLALQDLLTGRVPMTVDLPSLLLEPIRSGQLRGFATTGKNRHPALPEVPTMIERGITNVVSESWIGILAPKNTPSQFVEQLNGLLSISVQDSLVSSRMKDLGYVPNGSDGRVLGETLAQDIQKWTQVVRIGGIKLDL